MTDHKHKPDCALHPNWTDETLVRGLKSCTCGADKPTPPAPTEDEVRKYLRGSVPWIRNLTAKAAANWTFSDCEEVSRLLTAIPGILTALDRAQGRACAICNDTGYLEDAQAWDCGGDNSECPYCPTRVHEIQDKVDTLRAVRAPRLTADMRIYIQRLERVIVHAYVYSGYKDCGRAKMNAADKDTYDSIIERLTSGESFRELFAVELGEVE